MASEALELLLRANFAASVAILIVLGLRGPVRARFGPEVAYWLWLAPLLAAGASLLPARARLIPLDGAPLPAVAPDLLSVLLQDPGRARAGIALWLCGLAVTALALALSQLRFLRRARRGLEGPALVGVLSPRLVIPADYETRFTAEERQIIRAHERTHVDRGDTIANAFMAGLRNLCWFNPLVHLAVRFIRQDQELACDAAVLARHPGVRRRYAEALLKAHLAPGPLPLGCYWPAPSRHPLEERIRLLRQPAPRTRRHMVGTLSVLVLAAGVAAGAWFAKPVQLIAAPVEEPAAAPTPNMQFLIYRGAPVA